MDEPNNLLKTNGIIKLWTCRRIQVFMFFLFSCVMRVKGRLHYTAAFKATPKQRQQQKHNKLTKKCASQSLTDVGHILWYNTVVVYASA